LQHSFPQTNQKSYERQPYSSVGKVIQKFQREFNKMNENGSSEEIKEAKVEKQELSTWLHPSETL